MFDCSIVRFDCSISLFNLIVRFDRSCPDGLGIGIVLRVVEELFGADVHKNGAMITICDPVVRGVSDSVDHGNDGRRAKDCVDALGSTLICGELIHVWIFSCPWVH